MSKLYAALEDSRIEDNPPNNIPLVQPSTLEAVGETVGELQDDVQSLEIATEAFKGAFEKALVVEGMLGSLQEKKPLTEAYFVAMENYRVMIENLQLQTNVKVSLPAMEDYTNQYSAQACHEIATEGFMEIIRDAWKKIKEFFAAFFKRIMLFFKRVLKVDMELEEYEKYLDATIAKLKANKAKVPEGKAAPLTSKLPSMLAPPGIHKIEVDYLLNHGMEKINTLMEKMSEVGMKTMQAHINSDRGLPKFYRKLQDVMVRYEKIEKISVDDVRKDKSDLWELGYEMINLVFKEHIRDPRDLPEPVFHAISSSIDGDPKSLVISAISPLKGEYGSLPRRTNVFYATDESYKHVVTGYMDENSYVSSALNPIVNLDNLIRVYDFYRTRVKKIDLKNANNTIDELDSWVNKILDLMAKRYSQVMERAKDANHVVDLSTVQDFVTRIYDKLGESRDDWDRNEFRNEAMKTLSNYCNEYPNLPGVQDPNVLRVLQSLLVGSTVVRTDFDRACNPENGMSVMDALKVIGKGISDFRAFNINVEVDQGAEEELKARYAILTEMNKEISVIFTTLQTLYKSIVENYYGVYTQVRYELVKYIYDSARLYKY